MKIKLSFISILITIFILGIGVYFTVSFNRGTTNPKIQNEKSETIVSKTKTTDNTNIKSNFPLSNEDFVIKDNNNYIELGGKYEDLKTNEKITENLPPNEMKSYYIYVFENFKILTDGGIVGQIDLTAPILQTSRGIRIGDTISKVFEKYGEDAHITKYDEDLTKLTNNTGFYTYTYNGKSLEFYVDKSGEITDIRFEII